MCVGILCCAGSEACSAICACFTCCCKMTFKEKVRFGYVMLNLACFLFAVFILHYVQDIFSYFSSFIHCPNSSGGDLTCLGVSSVYRVSFSLALMYCIILLIVWTRNECSKLFNEGMWLLKIVFIGGIFIGFMYVDYSFFNGYRDFARIFGALFLVIQSVMLIDIFYVWGESWKAKYDAGAAWMSSVLLFTAIILYGLTLTLIILNFVWFNGCGLNTFLNIANLVIIIAFTVVQLLGYNPNGSLITSGAQALYMTFLIFSAQLSGDSSCNEALTNYDNIFTMELVVGLILLFVVQIYLTFASKKSSSQRIPVSNAIELNGEMLGNKEEEEEEDEEEKEELKHDEHDLEEHKEKINKDKAAESAAAISGENRNPEYEKWKQCKKSLRPYVYSNTFIIFHIVMFTSSVYGCMLLTNWGSPDMNSTTFQMYQPNTASYWIKTIVAWASSLLYIWTLIAPAIFKEREFRSDI